MPGVDGRLDLRLPPEIFFPRIRSLGCNLFEEYVKRLFCDSTRCAAFSSSSTVNSLYDAIVVQSTSSNMNWKAYTI